MMDPAAIVSRLANAGVQLQLDNGRLLTSAQHGAINEELATLIRTSRTSLIEFLERRSELDAKRLPPVLPASPSQRVQLSHAQRRLWLIHRMTGATAAYNMPAAMRIEGPLDRDALARALQAIMDRHEILRTVYEEREGEPTARVLDAARLKLSEIDLAAFTGKQQDEELTTRLHAECDRSFDLAAEPSLRATLFRLSATSVVLLVNVHHIAADGWSMSVLVRELVQYYEACVAGRSIDLPPLAVQYADYATWQREQLDSHLEPQLAYWREQLKDVPQRHGVPTDRARPAAPRRCGAVCTSTIDSNIAQKLTQLCQRHGATPFMALQLIFAVLLARWSNESDIAIGTPIAGRVRPELEDMIGLFVNTLVLRNRIDAAHSFREALIDAIRMASEAYENQHTPFDKLVDSLQLQRAATESPLVQIMFVMQNYARAAATLRGLTFTPFELSQSTAKFDLTLTTSLGEQGIVAAWEFDTELFDRPTVERMARHYVHLVAACVEHPELPLAQLDMLPASERRLLLDELNDTRRALPEGGLSLAFDRVAERQPSRIALLEGDLQVTYAQLRRQADALARSLLARQVSPEEPVGIFMKRGADMIVAMLAVLKAGGAYVPLDMSVPRDRLRFIVADSGMRIVVSSRRYADEAAALERRTILMEESSTSQEDSEPFGNAVPNGRLAYLMYTSGSSGQPKGVLVEQRGVLRLACNTTYMQLDASDTVAQASNSAFDASTFEIWAALLNGARLTFVDTDVLLDPERLQRQIETDAITAMWMTTSLLNQVARLCPNVFAPLEYLFFGGEAADLPSVERVVRAGKPRRLINIYGPTENTSFTTWYEVPAALEAGCPIGRPIDNTSCYVLGRHAELLPLGAVGELYTGGEGVARGYLNRDDLTQERFIENPFGAGTLYRTGDIVRWLPQGVLQFIGRADGQIKIRGFRVEAGEIEQALRSLGGVDDAVVIAEVNAESGKRLVAYATMKDDGLRGDAARRMRRQLSEVLPDYMVPAAIVLMDALPINENGKLDRQRLPAPDAENASLALEYEPAGEMELALAMLWCELLQIEKVGATTSFFDVGGNSLLIMRLCAWTKERLGVEVEVGEFFSNPTVRQQAAMLQTKERRRDSAAWIERAAPADRYPLSFPQQRLWFESLLGEATSYTVSVGMKLEGNLDERALESTLRDIVTAHEILRTTYMSVEGIGYQRIMPASAWTMQGVDLSGHADPHAVLQRVLRQDVDQPFDLERGPVFQAILYRLEPRCALLLLKMHHIVADGWSMQILMQQLQTSYTAHAAGSVAIPDLTPAIQYADFAVWQRSRDLSRSMTDSLQACVERLQFVHELPLLPVDGQRYQAASYPLGVRSFEISAPLAAGLKRVADATQTSIFTLALACLTVVIARYARQRKFVIGTDFAGRDLQQTEAAIGLFVNQLAIVAELDETASFEDFLLGMRSSTLFAYRHQHVPVERIVAALGLERRSTQHPLFQVKLVLQSFQSAAPMALPSLAVSGLPLHNRHSKLDLMLTLVEQAGDMQAEWEYNADYFEERTILHLQRELLEVIELAGTVPRQMRMSEFVDRLERRQGDRLAELRGRSEAGRRAKLARSFAKLAEDPIRSAEIAGGQTRIKVIMPGAAAVDAVAWIERHQEVIDDALARYGGILFRGFDIDLDASFGTCAKLLISQLQPYLEGATPRTRLSDSVYTSTEFPSDQSIAQHNELSYTLQWPMRISFACRQPAEQGGETPLTDVRRVVDNLAPEVVQRFEARQWMLVRNYGNGLGPSWQKAFGTHSLEDVRKYCAAASIELEIFDPQRIRTRQVRPAVRQHPGTAERVWFNHVAFWHPSSLESSMRAALLAQFEPEDLPYYTCWGDGTPIADRVIGGINEAYRRATLTTPWQRNDILLLDNMLIAHGRRSFAGSRSVIVAMGQA